MTEPSGSVTITESEIAHCTGIESVAHVMRGRGIPIKGYIDPSPHPDYAYTESVDYSRHTITITWSKL